MWIRNIESYQMNCVGLALYLPWYLVAYLLITKLLYIVFTFVIDVVSNVIGKYFRVIFIVFFWPVSIYITFTMVLKK